MKFFYVLACTVLLGTGCKKAVEKAQEDIIISAMTDGEWVVVSFTHNSVDLSADFSSFRFKYHSNMTVDALVGGTVEKTGTWDGDIATKTTWANFSNASQPLSLINGTWKITNNTWTYVVATQVVGNEIKSMRLEKL